MFAVTNFVNRSTRTNAKILRSAILAIIATVVIGSVLIIPIPSLSLMTSEESIAAMLAGEITSLFQGMTSHSQVMGPMAAIMCTFLFADMAFSIKKPDPLYMFMILACPYLIYKTSSRTGMGTLIAGIGMVTFLIMRARGIGRNWKGKLLVTINVIVVVFGIAAFAIPGVRSKVLGYVLKWSNGQQITSISAEEVISSRQGLIDESKRNFLANPVFGNGFQVSANMAHEKRSSLASYLSAPIEKGVWIYAIPEEGGIVGMILFCGWLIALFTMLISRHAYIGASVFFAFIVTNFGEFSIFSMSYIGGIYWTLTFAGVCLDVQRMKSTNMMIFDVSTEQVFFETGEEEWMRRQG